VKFHRTLRHKALRERTAAWNREAILAHPRKGITMRSGITRRIAIVATIATLALSSGAAVATPPVGATPTLLGTGTFRDHIKVKTANIKAKIKPSDFTIVQVDIAPGGSTGWHTHPGPALVIIKEGTFTLYDGDDPKCRPHRYRPGQAFVDEGGGHVHIGRNETTASVRLLVTFIVPIGATPTIDAPDPGNCQHRF
jgi:quercetin dioxygenase-like cupin family protein